MVISKEEIEQNLRGEYLKVFNEMVDYINLSKISKQNKKESIVEIYNNITYACKNDIYIKSYIKCDYRTYCEDIIGEKSKYTSKYKYKIEKIKEYLYLSMIFTIIYFIVQNYMMLKKQGIVSLNLQITSGMIMFIIGISIMLFIATSAINKESKKRCFDVNKNFIKNQGAIILTISSFALLILFNKIANSVKSITIIIPIYILISILLCIYIILNKFDKKLK